MTLLGLSALSIITLAWLIQLLHAWKHDKQLSDTFLLTYGIGMALLLVDAAQIGLTTQAWVYVITLLIVALIYIRTHR